MKKGILLLLSVILLSSCSAVKVVADYDSNVDFNQYKTFAFYKPLIDSAKISDLDKKRILRGIETELLAKGFTKSKSPDLLIGIFTKSREKVTVSRGGVEYGWGWNPYWGSMYNRINVNQYTEGTLFIDFIDTEKKELIWQGVGTGALKLNNRAKKEERIKLFVKEIISRFPPGEDK
jgi:hypothetical protein